MIKTILGVQIDDISENQALEMVRGWMESSKKHYIVTPNPEFIIAARSDSEFKEILNRADLKLPDGFGLKFKGVQNIIPGTDFMERLCEEASKKAWKVGFLGGRDGVAKISAERLRKKYPGLKVAVVEGGEISKDGDILRSEAEKSENSVSSRLHSNNINSYCDILFVGLGQRKQERWIVKNMDKVDSKVFMGVGGAFDYISGKIMRAPVFIRKLGFEWLFRLVIQPWRIKRQIALLKFVWLLLSRKS